MKMTLCAETPAQWNRFVKKYRAEMSAPENTHAVELLAALSLGSSLSLPERIFNRQAIRATSR
jgi:uncharacterized protein YeaO (DUF488 family)